MKRLKVCSLITAALVSASMTVEYGGLTALATTSSTNAQITSTLTTESSKVTVDVTNSNSSTSTNTLNPKFKVTNTSGAAINLSELKLKYYYNSDGSEKQNFWCDYSGTTSGTYKNFTGNVAGTINAFTADDGRGTNTYLQIAFTGGTLDAGQSMEVQTRIAKENWANYDQSNDYSFNASGTSPWNKVTAELSDTLVWGEAPVKIEDSVISPQSIEVDKASVKDTDIAIDYKGNTLNAIKNGDKALVKGQDYTEADGKIVLSQSYLSTLAVGDYSLLFDFNQGADSNLAVNVINSNAMDSVISPSSIDINKLSLKDVNVDVQYNGNVLKTIKNGDTVLTAGKDYKIVDGQVVLSKSYLSTLPVGQSALVFHFDGGKDQTLTINAIEDTLSVDIGSVSGNPGDTVVVPVKVQGIKTDKGLYAYNFKFSYDTTKFEDVTVTPGEGCPNPDSSFLGNVNASTGIISAQFYNPTSNDDPAYTIFNDGILVNISMKIKAGAEPGTSSLTIKDAGEYYGVPKTLESGDIDFNPYKVNYTIGSIDVLDNYESSVITPSTTEVSKQSPDPVSVSIDYKENTLQAIKNGDTVLTSGKDYTITDGKVVISRDYLKTLPVGQTVLVFDFNHGQDQKLTINVVEDTLNVSIGQVSGNPGDTVVVPVSVQGVKTSKGLYAYNFKLNYDTTKFEDVTVTPGEGCPNPDSSFFSSVNASTGIISAQFYNPTSNDDPAYTIFSDGVLVNVSLKIKSDATSGVSPITVKDAGEYYGVPKTLESGDIDFNPYKVSYTAGSVTIGTVTPVYKDSVITPTSVSFDKTTPSDANVDVQYNGNTLNAIKNGNTALTSGTDYTVTDGKVVISKTYLSTLPEGANTLLFDFSNGNDQNLTVNVTKTVVVVDSKLDKSTASFNSGSPADISVGVTYNGNTLSGIKDSNNYTLVKGTDYTVQDNTIVLSQKYLSTLAAGSVVLTFDFSGGNDQTLTINVTKQAAQLAIATDAINVTAGQTFQVPILLKNVPTAGILVGSVNIDYDSSVLECVSFTNGSLITSPSTDFFGENVTDSSLVSMNFMQTSSTGARSIKTDGTFAIVTFKVKDTAAKGVTTLKEDPTLKISMYQSRTVALPFDVSFGNINVQ